MPRGRRGKLVIALAVFFASVFSVTQAHSDLIYSTYDTGHTFSTTGLTVGTYIFQSVTYTALQGVPFTPSFNAKLDSISFAAKYTSGLNALDVILTSDSGGVPGTALETFTFSGLATTGTIYTANSSLHVALNQGTQYWVVLAAQGNGYFSWNENINLPGSVAIKGLQGYPDTNWHVNSSIYTPVFDVNGTPVPIPGAVWLLGSGLLGLVAIRRRFKK
jgi:hypothetical protein